MPNVHVLIILVGLLLGRDLARSSEAAVRAHPIEFVFVSAWVMLVAVVALVALPSCAKAAAHRGSWKLLRTGLSAAQTLRWLVVMPFATWSIVGDGIGAVEGLIGSWIGLDEALAATPPLLALIAIAWAEHPLHDRMRQAMMMRQLDAGGVLERPPTRREAVVGTVRSMLAMPLVPVMLIVCWHETLSVVVSDREGWLVRALDFGGVITIVAIAPAIIVRVLGTRPMHAGDLHERINDLCKQMGAHVSGIRLWAHPSANAAILGVLPVARYMLITEPLVRGMPRHELDAVVAHELAHVRQHHVLWIVLAMIAGVGVLSVAQPVLGNMLAGGGLSIAASDGLAMIFVLIAALLWFGFVSRLIERHADARAAVAVGKEIARAQGVADGVVHPAGPACMAAALDRVCVLNGVDPARWGFRHGSVVQRQRALASIAGHDAGRLPVDRRVALLRLATLLGIAGLGLFVLAGLSLGWFESPPTPSNGAAPRGALP